VDIPAFMQSIILLWNTSVTCSARAWE